MADANKGKGKAAGYVGKGKTAPTLVARIWEKISKKETDKLNAVSAETLSKKVLLNDIVLWES